MGKWCNTRHQSPAQGSPSPAPADGRSRTTYRRRAAPWLPGSGQGAATATRAMGVRECERRATSSCCPRPQARGRMPGCAPLRVVPPHALFWTRRSSAGGLRCLRRQQQAALQHTPIPSLRCPTSCSPSGHSSRHPPITSPLHPAHNAKPLTGPINPPQQPCRAWACPPKRPGATTGTWTGSRWGRGCHRSSLSSVLARAARTDAPGQAGIMTAGTSLPPCPPCAVS